MRYSATHKQETREKLIRKSRELAKKEGFGSTGVDAFMKAIDLTGGAFYTHFESKEALCAEVIPRASRRSGATLESMADWRASIEAYLSPKHVRDRANGCPFAALAGDVPRESEAIRAAFSEALQRSIDATAARLGDKDEASRREEAIQALATMVGALVLARTAATPQLRDEILGAARNKLLKAPRT